MDRYLEAVEPGLAYARERLSSVTDAARDVQPALLKDALGALRACRGYLTLYRKPVLRSGNPAAIMAACFPSGGTGRIITRVETARECVYDPEQAAACLECVVGTARLDEGARLWIELFEDDEVPQIAVSLDGPGHLPDTLSFGGYVDLALDELGTRWTAATRGGRIDKTTNGIALRLKGIRDSKESVEGLEAILDAVTSAERSVKTTLQRIGLAADGISKPGSSDEWREAVRTACAAVDVALRIADGGPMKMEPADLTTILAEVETEWRRRIDDEGIRIEALCDANIPPLAMHRRSIRSVFRTILMWGLKALPEGGVISILMEYALPRRAADLVITFAGDTVRSGESFYAASLRRGVVEQHKGALDCRCDVGDFTLSATLTDTIGTALTEWIPGFDAFSDRSKQMLRLLKGSGQQALEDVILSGVLEEELERWLLPRLESPTVIHLARDLRPDNRGLPGSSSERLEKAMGQVQRGKPRKEICKPQYAGELLWAFREDERHRSALGMGRLEDSGLESLCAALLQTPVDCVAALRIIAGIIS